LTGPKAGQPVNSFSGLPATGARFVPRLDGLVRIDGGHHDERFTATELHHGGFDLVAADGATD